MASRRQKIEKPKKLPFQDLYKDGISFSSLSKFVTCRERFRIYYVEGLKPEGISGSIEFGNMFHFLLEEYSKKRSMQELEAMHFAKVRNEMGSNAQLTTAVEVWVVFEEYVAFWKTLDKKVRYVSQEENFRETVRLPSGRTLDIKGRFDEIFRKSDNGLWLQENKTKSRIEDNVLTHILPYDLQTMMYCYAIQLKYKETPKGVLYNVIRQPGLKEKKNETLVDYGLRLRQDIQSRKDFYFIRYEIDITKQVIEDFKKKTLIPLLESVCLWWESIQHNPFDPWVLPDGSVNLNHWQRPFGVYDPFRFGKGDYFDLITRGITVGLKRIDEDKLSV
jgi:hypothetical protein